MVLGGDVPSDCNLASFRHARFFDFFNEIGQNRKRPLSSMASAERRFRPFAPPPSKPETECNSDIHASVFAAKPAVIPPASRPAAAQRGKWLQTTPGSWEHNQRRASCERCLDKSPHPRDCEPRR